MGAIKTAADKAFRDYKDDGYPGSGENEPDKREIREAFDIIDSSITAAANGVIQSGTWAGLSSSAGTMDFQPGRVIGPDNGTHVDPLSGQTVTNEGEYRWSASANAWVWVSPTVQSQLDVIPPQLDLATQEATDRGTLYADDVVDSIDDEEGNAGVALLRNGRLLAKIRGGALSAEFLDYDTAVDKTDPDGSEEGTVIYAIRRKDGLGWIGARPGDDIRVFLTGDEGNRTVWAALDGQRPWSLTSTPGNYHCPLIEGYLIKWIEIVDGIAIEHSALPIVRTSPLDPSVTRIEQILGVGQSLVTGAYDTVVVHGSPVVPGFAISFNSGARTLPNHDEAGVDTPINVDDIAYFINLQETNQKVSRRLGETICSGAAARMKRAEGIAPTSAVLFSVHGIGGQSIEDVWEGTVPFDNSIVAVTRGKQIADAEGKEFACLSASFVGGESNRQNTLTQYSGKLLTYHGSYKTRINAITGNEDNFVIVSCQMSNWTAFASTFATSDVPLAQLQTAIDDPDKFACVGPKYFLDTYTDGVHLTGVSEARLGAYHGRVHEAISKGQPWKPLYPTAAVRTGASVVLTFNVPEGPLVFDTALVSDPGNFGFEWHDSGDGNAVTISNVTITGQDQVTITLSEIPTGSNQQVGIGRTGIIGNHGGPTSGPRSNLRDSSSDIDDMGYPMYNWCCHSLIAVI